MIKNTTIKCEYVGYVSLSILDFDASNGYRTFGPNPKVFPRGHRWKTWARDPSSALFTMAVRMKLVNRCSFISDISGPISDDQFDLNLV